MLNHPARNALLPILQDSFNKVNQDPDYGLWRTRIRDKRFGILLAAGINPDGQKLVLEDPDDWSFMLPDEFGALSSQWEALHEDKQAKFLRIKAEWAAAESLVKPVSEWLLLAQSQGHLSTRIACARWSYADYRASQIVEQILRVPLRKPWNDELRSLLANASNKTPHSMGSPDYVRGLCVLRKHLMVFRDDYASHNHAAFSWLQKELSGPSVEETVGISQVAVSTMTHWLDAELAQQQGPAVENDGLRMVAWRRAIVDNWKGVVAKYGAGASARQVIAFLKDHDITGAVVRGGDALELNWKTNNELQKAVKLKTVQHAIKKLKDAGLISRP